MNNLRPLTFSRRHLLAIAAGTGIALSSRAGSTAAESSRPAWKSLPSDGPPARWDHMLAADESGIGLVLFGGRDTNGVELGDTWVYDIKARAWTRIETAAPSPRFGSALASDRQSGRVLLFGGQSATEFFNDTWGFDLESREWTLLESGASAPSPRYGLPGAIDGDGSFVISHGFTFEGRFDDTWSFDLGTAAWTNVTPQTARPLNRCLHEMAWDSDAGALVLYAGCSSGFGPCPQGDVWTLDSTAGVWSEITPAAGPAARTNPAMVYDDRNQQFVMVAGSTADGYVNDIWSGRLTDGGFTWEALDVEGEGPSPRASHDMAMVRGDIYLFGGTGVDGVTADLWKLSLT